MADQMMAQVKLSSFGLLQTVWLPHSDTVKVGAIVTLKDYPDPDRQWMIIEVYSVMPRSKINRGWENNI